MVGIEEVVRAGVGLAFVTFPAAINTLGTFAPVFGVLFFLSLTFAGISSLISINEAAISAFMDKFDMERKKAVVIYVGVAATCSLLFASGGGLYILDILDKFINSFGIVFAGLIQVILIGWFFNLKSVQEHVNAISDFAVGTWWIVCIKFITPVILGYMAVMNLVDTIRTGYDSYPTQALIVMGWIPFGIVVVGGFLLATLKWKDEKSLLKGVVSS